MVPLAFGVVWDVGKGKGPRRNPLPNLVTFSKSLFPKLSPIDPGKGFSKVLGIYPKILGSQSLSVREMALFWASCILSVVLDLFRGLGVPLRFHDNRGEFEPLFSGVNFLHRGSFGRFIIWGPLVFLLFGFSSLLPLFLSLSPVL